MRDTAPYLDTAHMLIAQDIPLMLQDPKAWAVSVAPFIPNVSTQLRSASVGQLKDEAKTFNTTGHTTMNLAGVG